LYYLIRNYSRRQHEKKEKEIYESKIDFFTNVAHEIRTPLTLIKGPVDNLIEKKYQLPDSQEDLACLDRNTNRLMNLVSQILDFRQTEIKRFSLDLQKANVSEIVRETYLSFNILAKKKKLDYRLLLPPNDVFASVDAEAFYKILSNLIGNAVKYADKNVGVQLYVSDKEKKMLVMEFENDGHVIKKEYAEKIFEPFYRIKETGNKKGTGIGLTLTKSLVDLHNGSLELAFTKKDCNVFVLSIPVLPEMIPDEKPKLTLPHFS
jgi:signal transduction histidine kinase